MCVGFGVIRATDFMSADLPAGYGHIMPSDFTSLSPPTGQGSPAARRHTKI